MWPFKKKEKRLLSYAGKIDLQRFPQHAQRMALARQIHDQFVAKFGHLLDKTFKTQLIVCSGDGGVAVVYKLTTKDADTLTAVGKALYDMWDAYTVA